MPSRKRVKSKTKPEEPITPHHSRMWFLSQFGLQQQETEAYGLGLRFQEFMQTAEECVAEAHGQAEQERGRFFGRAAGVKFRLRTVVSARRHSATRQCHNKHATWWEFVNSAYH